MNLDVKLDFNEIFDKVAGAISKSLDVAKEDILPVMAKQMVIEGVTHLVFYLLALILAILCLTISTKRMTRGDDDVPAFLLLVAGIVSAGAVLFGGILDNGILDAVTKVFNPEYAVMKEIVDMAKELVGGK